MVRINNQQVQAVTLPCSYVPLPYNFGAASEQRRGVGSHILLLFNQTSKVLALRFHATKAIQQKQTGYSHLAPPSIGYLERWFRYRDVAKIAALGFRASVSLLTHTG